MVTPGRNSSEFWLIISFLVMIIANGTTYVDVPWDTIEWLAGLIGVYTGGRSWVKTTVKKEPPSEV